MHTLMVKIQTLPDPKVIRAFRGHVDFYSWKGIAIARGWPKKPDQSRAPNIRLQQPHLVDATKRYRDVSFLFKDSLTYQARHGAATARDIWMRHYFGTVPGLALDQKTNHPHQYGHTPAFMGPLRGRLSRFSAQLKPSVPGHQPPPAFPFPDQFNHYWGVLSAGPFSSSDTGDLFVSTLLTIPGNWQIVTFNALPTLETQYSFRRGLRRLSWHAWSANVSTLRYGPSSGQGTRLPVFTLAPWQAIAPLYIYFYFKRHHGTDFESGTYARSPLYVLYVRTKADYIAHPAFDPMATPRPFAPGFALPDVVQYPPFPHES